MQIINELASATIKKNKRDTLATRLSILSAVILLGSLIFIVSFLKADKYHEIVSTVGDYQVSLSGISKDMYASLPERKEIQKLSFARVLQTDLGATIYEKEHDYWQLEGFELKSGRKPANGGELIVPLRFLLKNKAFKLGSALVVDQRSYAIVGTYDDYAYSFEEPVLLGYLDDLSQENLFAEGSGLEAFIWYKHPRDTYTATKALLKDLNIDDKKAENTGRLYFNKDILEYKMIYPEGLIPPKKVLVEAAELYTPVLLLSLLFAVMIYGAFNVWNSRDLKEMALLKSVGMTERQVKKMVRIKALRLSLLPIFIGTVLAYSVANLLLYLMWVNNAITYSKLSNIFREKLQAPAFKLIPLPAPVLLLIVLLAFFTVYLSALLPARRSAKLKIIEGLNGLPEKKTRVGKSKISGRIEASLAADYYKTYRSTYRTIILAILISAMVLTIVLVSQSYRRMCLTYDQFHSPYPFKAQIYTESELDQAFREDLDGLKGIDELHVCRQQDFKFFLADNEGFLSAGFQAALAEGKKDEQDLYVRIYGLSDEDFRALLKEKGIASTTSFLLLNKIASDNTTPYAFRTYLPVSGRASDAEVQKIHLRYNAEGKVMTVPIEAAIDAFPYELDSPGQNGIYLFTPMSKLESFIKENGHDEADPVNYYTIKFKAGNNLSKAADQCERIISAYVPKSDYRSTTDLLQQAADKEVTRNEHLFNAGVQIILLTIALSNAYNSFHGNLRSRKREFQVLFTIGMTEKQMKRMILSESRILFGKTLLAYFLAFCLTVSVRAYRSHFAFMFAVKEILGHLNYLPICVIFLFLVLGILLAMRSSIKSILQEDSTHAIKEIV